MLVKKICLTGGPCAGKTSALSKVQEDLEEKGYKVFIIDEVATMYINKGIRPFGEDSLSWYDFETLVLKTQVLIEQSYEVAAKNINKPCVIICDRGIFDIKSFIDDDMFNRILKENNLSKLNLMDNYDLVIHMNTAAKGAKEFYTLDNNKARSEDIDLAIKRDDACQKAWDFHHNYEIVTNECTFEEKLQRVVDIINSNLGIRIRKQRKYLINMTDKLDKKLKEDSCTKISIEQTYLKNDDNNEIRLRKRVLDSDITYFLSIKKDHKVREEVITYEKIDKETFEKLLSARKIQNIVTKKRVCFAANDSIYKVDIFLDKTYVLETDNDARLPDFIEVIKDVSLDEKFKNKNIKN